MVHRSDGHRQNGSYIPCALRLAGPLRADALHRALETIVHRHEVLRTTLVPAAGEAQPRRLESVALPMPVHDLMPSRPTHAIKPCNCA